jgi:purine-binding chemotaxis protein CheW
MRPAEDPGERTRRILEERAQILARPIESENSFGHELELLHFNLDQERYAMETCFVRRITRAAKFSRISGLPAYFMGVMNLHGEIVPLVSLSTLIGIAPSAQTELSRTIILGRSRVEFGIAVDDVAEILDVSIDLIAPLTGERSEQTFIRGTLLNGVVVLDGAALFEDARLIVSEGALPKPSREKAE